MVDPLQEQEVWPLQQQASCKSAFKSLEQNRLHIYVYKGGNVCYRLCLLVSPGMMLFQVLIFSCSDMLYINSVRGCPVLSSFPS